MKAAFWPAIAAALLLGATTGCEENMPTQQTPPESPAVEPDGDPTMPATDPAAPPPVDSGATWNQPGEQQPASIARQNALPAGPIPADPIPTPQAAAEADTSSQFSLEDNVDRASAIELESAVPDQFGALEDSSETADEKSLNQ